MKTTFLQLVGVIPISVLFKQVVPADIAPPPGVFVVAGLGILIVLGLVVAVIVLISVLVIRALKKNNTRKDDA